MAGSKLPSEKANPFLREVLGVKVSTSPDPGAAKLIDKAPDPPPVPANGSANSTVSDGKPLRRFVGFLDEMMPDGRRKIYTSSLLDEGVEILQNAIRVHRRLPASDADGLVRDVVWLDVDADIFYFSRRQRLARDPSGGDGFPRHEPIVGA